jgi:hypothetical protein
MAQITTEIKVKITDLKEVQAVLYALSLWAVEQEGKRNLSEADRQLYFAATALADTSKSAEGPDLDHD